MVFRFVARIFGCCLFAAGIYFACVSLMAGLVGDVSLERGIVGCLICLGVGACTGLLFLFFEPHQVIQNFGWSVHQLIGSNERRSFSERIGVGDEGDGGQDG